MRQNLAKNSQKISIELILGRSGRRALVMAAGGSVAGAAKHRSSEVTGGADDKSKG